MEMPTREQLENRLSALVADALDNFDSDNPEGYDLGVVGIVLEVFVERPGSDYLKRTDGGYTPSDDVSSYIGYWCSDHRAWMQESFFETAYRVARGDFAQPVPDTEEDADEGDIDGL